MLDLRRTLLALLAPPLLAGCGEQVTIPAETRLVAELGSRLDATADSAGAAVEARLTGDLAAGDRVLLPRGTVLTGRVTAVQARTERRPWAVAIAFDSVRIGGRGHAVPLEVISVEARPPAGDDGAPGAGGAPAGGGLVGEVVGGRSGAPLLQRRTLEAPGQAVVLGTRDEPAVLPAGARIELRVTAPIELPAPGG